MVDMTNGQKQSGEYLAEDQENTGGKEEIPNTVSRETVARVDSGSNSAGGRATWSQRRALEPVHDEHLP